jgi:dihydroorotase
MPDLHLQRGRVLDPAAGVDREADVVLVGGRIAAVGPGLSTPAGATPVDARGWLVVPGLIDLHTHLREPGEEYKEDVASASAAAAAGGFTAVCAMPNTKPPNDCRAVTELVLARAREVGGVRVHPIGAITKGLAGESLTEVGELVDAGCVALSDDGRPVMDARLMRRALEYARGFGLPVIQHAEDLRLSEGAAMNEGPAATRAGLRGAPVEAEEVMVARDLALVERTGGRYHVAHVSAAKTVLHVREAKKRGLPVTCEVAPHHLVLTDTACLSYDTSFKVNPPLRSERDRAALAEALADGTIDAVATDHAPHSSVEKDVPFDSAAFGMVGLETALPVVLGMVEKRVIDLTRAIRLFTIGPAKALRLAGGTLAPGAPADVTCIDLEAAWTVEPERLRSKSRNTPFAGWKMKGRAVLTLVGGRVVHGEVR